jgi:ribosomal protein L40E
MALSKYTLCEYCGTQNPKEATACLACGAPLEFHPKKTTPPQAAIPVMTARSNRKPEDEIKDVSEKIDEAFLTVMNTYSIAWRTIGEAIAIAITGFIIGVVGGATGMEFWSILGATVIGIAVGFTQKNFYVVLFSAPGGALIGLFFGAIFWIGGKSEFVVFVVTITAVIAAIIGGRRRPAYNVRNWWEKLRPFLGGLGGLGFGALGTLLGLGITGMLGLFQ